MSSRRMPVQRMVPLKLSAVVLYVVERLAKRITYSFSAFNPSCVEGRSRNRETASPFLFGNVVGRAHQPPRFVYTNQLILVRAANLLYLDHAPAFEKHDVFPDGSTRVAGYRL
jgi:hypothetical protein